MKTLFVCFVALFLASCTNAGSATRDLEAAGYTNIHITGYNWFGCGKDDAVHTGFTATGINGKPITGVVCGGLFFKNQTIRTD